MAVGRVAKQHGNAQVSPEVQVIEPAKHHDLDEGEIQPRTSQLGVQERCAGHKRCRVACHGGQVAARVAKGEQSTTRSKKRLDCRQDKPVDKWDRGNSRDGCSAADSGSGGWRHKRGSYRPGGSGRQTWSPRIQGRRIPETPRRRAQRWVERKRVEKQSSTTWGAVTSLSKRCLPNWCKLMREWRVSRVYRTI